MSSSGTSLRPRYGRIAAVAVAASTTLVTLVGTLFTGPAQDPAGSRSGLSLAAAADASSPAASSRTDPQQPDAAVSAALATASSTGLRASLSVGLPPQSGSTQQSTQQPLPSAAAEAAALPERSGVGRRVVFSESEQRVWLVRANGAVARTYLVSGSLYDNLDPGTYEVYSHSATAIGVDGSDLRWMVRFTQGDTAAIGFHSIPRMDGEPMQTRAELGTPLSHGCIRQASPDARALWRFAPVGTTVVVTA